jgi:hypothetical protein
MMGVKHLFVGWDVRILHDWWQDDALDCLAGDWENFATKHAWPAILKWTLTNPWRRLARLAQHIYRNPGTAEKHVHGT